MLLQLKKKEEEKKLLKEKEENWKEKTLLPPPPCWYSIADQMERQISVFSYSTHHKVFVCGLVLRYTAICPFPETLE